MEYVPAYKTLGFNSYQEYLQSDLWKKIRLRVLRKYKFTCVVCNGRANTVHHKNYCLKTMAGKRDKNLIALCESCHHKIEFNGDEKNTRNEANRKLRSVVKMLRLGIPLEEAWNNPSKGRIREYRKQHRNMDLPDTLPNIDDILNMPEPLEEARNNPSRYRKQQRLKDFFNEHKHDTPSKIDTSKIDTSNIDNILSGNIPSDKPPPKRMWFYRI